METNEVTELAVIDPPTGTATPELAVPAFDLTSSGNLPDLATAQDLALDLMSDYWTPDKVGEEKRVFFVKVGQSAVKDMVSGEVTSLESVFFLEREADGNIKQIRNGSRRLVGAIQSALEQGMIRQGSPLLITYLGKKANRTNAYKSDNWSVRPLLVNIG